MHAPVPSSGHSHSGAPTHPQQLQQAPFGHELRDNVHRVPLTDATAYRARMCLCRSFFMAWISATGTCAGAEGRLWVGGLAGVAPEKAGGPQPAPAPSHTSSSSGNVDTPFQIPHLPGQMPGQTQPHPTVHMGVYYAHQQLPTPQAPQTPPWGLPRSSLMWSQNSSDVLPCSPWVPVPEVGDLNLWWFI